MQRPLHELVPELLEHTLFKYVDIAFDDPGSIDSAMINVMDAYEKMQNELSKGDISASLSVAMGTAEEIMSKIHELREIRDHAVRIRLASEANRLQARMDKEVIRYEAGFSANGFEQ